MAIVRNLATVKTTAGITSSATSIPVNRVDVFGTSQTTLDNPFYVTIMPASGDEPANSSNSEIVLVTGISGLNLTVTRGQRSTTAKAFSSGAIVTMGIYAEDAVLLGDGGTAVGTPAPWVDTSDIKNGAITTDKIADKAVTSDKVDWETLKCGIVSDPVSETIPANGRTRIAQITLPKGKYALIATASYWASKYARRCLYISFESSTGGTINSMKNGLYGDETGGDTLEATNTALVNITAEQATVSVYANSQDFSGTFNQWGAPSVLYFRVG